jgi:anti-sigma regulatory factor (Ser/Thr protein kinase)
MRSRGGGIIEWAWLLEQPALETSVTEDDALHIKQGAAWQLLLEFPAPGGVAGEDTAVQRIAEAVGELDVQAAQRARIEGAVVEALRKAVQRDLRDQHTSPMSIRVWISDLSTAKAIFSSGTRKVSSQKSRGWGFFLLERLEDDPHTKEVESHRLIELYLYQETARVV